jgi:hypothetical protein
MLGTDASGDLLLVVDSVLQGDHRGRGVQQRGEQIHRPVGVIGLHTEQHDVARADVSGIIGCG